MSAVLYDTVVRHSGRASRASPGVREPESSNQSHRFIHVGRGLLGPGSPSPGGAGLAWPGRQFICDSPTDVPALPLAGRHAVVLAALLAMSITVAQAQAGPATPSIVATMLKWTPLLARGFALNIAMSFLAMAIGTVFGFALGLGQISLLAPLRAGARLIRVSGKSRGSPPGG
jgi:hypothetical protein